MKLSVFLLIFLFLGGSCSDFSQPSGDSRRPQRKSGAAATNDDHQGPEKDSGDATEAEDQRDKNSGTETNVATSTNRRTDTGSSSSTASNTSTDTATGPKVVEFRIRAGTGTNPWNTRDTMVTVKVGDTLKIINEDSRIHRLHTTAEAPCPHPGNDLRTGQVHLCKIENALDVGNGLPSTYDHTVGTSAAFYLRAVK